MDSSICFTNNRSGLTIDYILFHLNFTVVGIFALTVKVNTGTKNYLSHSLWICIAALLGQGVEEPLR